jgi:hypothetical protein
MQIKLEVVHLIKGRARIVIKSEIEPEVLFLVMQAALQEIRGISKADFNPWAQSVTIYFKADDPYAIFDKMKEVLEGIVCDPLFPQRLAQIEDAVEHGSRDSINVTVRDHILSVSTTLDRAVKKMTGNAIDLKTLLPVTSFTAGLMTLALAPGLPTPTWLVLVIFGFTGFHVGHNHFGANGAKAEDDRDTGVPEPEGSQLLTSTEEQERQAAG